MATRADVDRYVRANRDIRTLVLRDLTALWARLDHSKPLAVRAAVEEFLPVLTASYGEIAATVAADFFDDLRDAAGVAGRFSAVLAEVVDAERVRAQGRWAITPLFAEEFTPDRAVAALGRLSQVADTLSLEPGRQTVARSVGRDPANARWARTPVGHTCAFCLMAASRGAVYRSEDTAAASFHSGCDCVPTPVWRGSDLPYDPAPLQAEYRAARSAAGSGDTKAVLSELRKQQDIH